MKQNNIAKTIALGTASAAMILMMGVGVLAENNLSGNRLQTSKNEIMDILTEEQKDQIKQTEKKHLDDALKNGSITQQQYDERMTSIEQGEPPRMIIGSSGKMNGKGMEDFQKNQEERKAKWDALTEEEKQELEDLADEKLSLELKTIDKQVELGLLDRETADIMQEDLDKMNKEIKENGGFGFGGVQYHFNIERPDTFSFEEAGSAPHADRDASA